MQHLPQIAQFMIPYYTNLNSIYFYLSRYFKIPFWSCAILLALVFGLAAAAPVDKELIEEDKNSVANKIELPGLSIEDIKPFQAIAIHMWKGKI